MRGKRVLVCGSRHGCDYRIVWDMMNHFAPSHICTGGATGVDTLAEDWAKGYGVPCAVYPADWRKEGKAAGPIRNQRMLDEFKPDICIAFPGGRGTQDMVRRCEKAGVSVLRITDDAARPNAEDMHRGAL